uniref:mannose-6-phosphate isomerase n=1 Tax=Trypanosoma congolense (strain IL3000) TaxID=1068625 RepID=G0V2W7_TRYCI|nr:unnamed protein product [Trypanosoma congolense IL3000]
MSNCMKLNCGVQHYAWGKHARDSFIAKMKGESDKEGKYAELWVGTHVNCPSKTVSGQLLSDFLLEHQNMTRFFHPKHQQDPRFCNCVPFLLKVLSIQTALSIQAHPNKKLAERLHRENPDKYKDPNHKPELIIALTPFEALCCFRPLRDVARFVDAAPPLKAMLGAAAVIEGDVDDKRTLKRMMDIVYNTDAEKHASALRQHAEALRGRGAILCKEDTLFLRVLAQYPNDMGCWMVYFLNYLVLQPGDGLFLADSEPHAYLFGDGVEIMASSDNVVRAGLTPKWKDVPTLLEMLRYSTDGLEGAMFRRQRARGDEQWEIQYYAPPCEFPDFSIYRLEHVSSSNGRASVMLPTVGLGFCVGGSGMVNGEGVSMGDCFMVPYGEMKFEARGECKLFVASMNDTLRTTANL